MSAVRAYRLPLLLLNVGCSSLSWIVVTDHLSLNGTEARLLRLLQARAMHG